jgi:type 2 lantibiotic biosynthesis protein LanM
MTLSNLLEAAESAIAPATASVPSAPVHYFELTEVEQALLPFMAWADPYVRDACEQVIAEAVSLARQHPGSMSVDGVVASIRTAFVRPTLALCQRTLVLELGVARHKQQLQAATPEGRFDEYITWLSTEQGRSHIRQQYPHLHAAAVQCVALTTQGIRHLLERIAKARAQLDAMHAETAGLGALLGFRTEMGDRHVDGDSVARLDFEHGRLYYKPRSMAIDVAFEGLIQWLNTQGIGPDQAVPQTLDCGDHGFVTEIVYRDARDEQELRDYYRRFGGLVAIGHILATTDLHHENVVASGGYPVIIDNETLLQPNHSGRRGRQSRRNPFADTVLYSGLLPHGDTGSIQNDRSALFMPHESLYSRAPTGAGTDELRLQVIKLAMPFSANMARLNGQMVEPHRYVDEIDSGFEVTYRGLLAAKATLLADDGPLAPFRRMRVRTVLRPTQVYAYLLAALSHPDYLRDNDKREALIARIRPGKDGWQFYRRIWPAERRALLRGDVPYFTSAVESRDCLDERGKTISRLFGSSAWREAQHRIRGLSLKDLQRQRRLLHEAVFCTRPPQQASLWNDLYPPHPAVDARDASRDTLLHEATVIADRIIAAGYESAGHVDHFQLALRGHDVLRPYHSGPELYDGVAGLAVFMGELALQTGQARYRRAFEILLSSARRELTQYGPPMESIGAYSGLTSWLYTLMLLGSRHNRAELVDEALTWLPRVGELIAQDKMLDVIGGSAGALLVLCELERLAPGRGALDVARRCAEHLAATAIVDDDGARWVCESYPGMSITGFSHGTAGMAAALGRFAEVSGESAYRKMSLAALRFERATYGETGWRDLRTAPDGEHCDDAHPYAWCHGAPGIGLGRLALPRSMHDKAWHDDVAHSIHHTCEHGLGGGHCLCHGQLGNLELLIAYDQAYPGNTEAATWRGHMARIVDEGRKAWRTGSVDGHDLLGLMTGLAGIGYALLRAADPAGVPSVLLLEIK